MGLGMKVAVLPYELDNVPDHVFEDLRPVGALHQRAELGADLVLAGACHFVVEHFDRNAQRFEDQRDLGAQVLRAVDRRNREITALDGRTMAAVAAFDLLAGVPRRFVFVDLDERARHVGTPAHVVEDEEFGLRTEVGGVAHAGGLEVGLGALGDRARIAVVGLAVAGLDHVAAHEQRGLFEERIDVGGVRVGHQLHVRGFDAFPATNRRAVEGMAGSELVFVEMRNRHRHVLLLAPGVGKTEVNELDFVFLHHLDHVCDGLGHQLLLLSGC